MIVNQSAVNKFESEIRAVLDFDYVVDGNHSRSSYLATCKDVPIPLPDDNEITKKEIAWEFDLMQKTYEINVVARSTSNPRIVWIGKGASAKEAYANLAMLP